MLAGAAGVVNVRANYEPETFVRAYSASLQKDSEELAKMQERVERVEILRRSLCLGGPCWLSGVKYGMSTLGIGSGKPVSPLQPAPENQRKRIDEITKKKGVGKGAPPIQYFSCCRRRNRFDEGRDGEYGTRNQKPSV